MLRWTTSHDRRKEHRKHLEEYLELRRRPSRPSAAGLWNNTFHHEAPASCTAIWIPLSTSSITRGSRRTRKAICAAHGRWGLCDVPTVIPANRHFRQFVCFAVAFPARSQSPAKLADRRAGRQGRFRRRFHLRGVTRRGRRSRGRVQQDDRQSQGAWIPDQDAEWRGERLKKRSFAGSA